MRPRRYCLLDLGDLLCHLLQNSCLALGTVMSDTAIVVPDLVAYLKAMVLTSSTSLAVASDPSLC